MSIEVATGGGRAALRVMSAVCATMVIAACTTTPKVQYDADPSANFSTYRTYSWAYQTLPSGANPLISQRIVSAVDNALAAKGYTKSGAGDFAIGFTVGSRDRVEVNQLGGWGPYYRPWGGWGGYGGSVDVRNVTDGTLTLDVYDVKSKAAVWHGTATAEITSKSASEAYLTSTVQAVLANFPPPPAVAK